MKQDKMPVVAKLLRSLLYPFFTTAANHFSIAVY
jgi:hypothetical protein